MIKIHVTNVVGIECPHRCVIYDKVIRVHNEPLCFTLTVDFSPKHAHSAA